jgi:YD repeat-containing protein
MLHGHASFFGNRTTWSYDALDRVTRVTDW